MLSKIHLNPDRIEIYKKEYEDTNCVFLPEFLDRNTLEVLLKKLKEQDFSTKTEMEGENKFGKVLALPLTHPALVIFNMLLNDPKLFDTLQQITGCADISDFSGRIHRSAEGEDHEIGWHGDNSDNRLLAITLGLGTENYTGAQFELRKKGSSTNMREFSQIKAGDAFIFRIHPQLHHRLAVIQSGTRTVGVGWFRGYGSKINA